MVLMTWLTGRRRDRRGERGAVAIMVALISVSIFIICGLVVDLGNGRVQRSRAQDAADAASLAAANALYASGGTANLPSAVTAAETYAANDFGTTTADWASCVDSAHLAVTSSASSCISFDSATAPTTVRVLIPTRHIPTTFGRLAGVNNMAVSGAADATVKPGDRAACGLCVVGSGTHNIQNGNITISGASVDFNGSVIANSNGSITVTGTGSTISIQGTVSSAGTFTPAPATNQPAINDPLASVTLPPSTVGLSMKSGSACTGGPGIYLDSFQFTSCTLQPGLYVLAGTADEDSYSGGTQVVAPGVTFYFTCKTTTTPVTMRACNSNNGAGEAGAGLLFTGNAALTFTAPASGATQGLAIVSDRNNTEPFGFRGNGTDPSSGTIYGLSAQLQYNGNGNGPALDALTVVHDITFNGNNASFTSQYTQSKNYQLPPGQPYLSH